LAERKEVKKEAIILMSSNRGLCGGFNSAIIQKAINSIKKYGILENELVDNLKKEKRKDVDFIVVGKKGLVVRSRYGANIAADFEKADACSEIREVMPLSKLVIDDFLSGKYDKVLVAYTDFISPTKQLPRVKQLLPIDLNAKDHHLGIVGNDPRVGIDIDYVKEKETKYPKDEKNSYIFTYEPSPEEVLGEMLPRLIEIQLYQALLESNASEHSARMNSMHQATEAANDLVKELQLYYNKARQAGITAEISEIVAGVNALSQ
jgi:F-type H+-transporting ATPase subunit gamma